MKNLSLHILLLLTALLCCLPLAAQELSVKSLECREGVHCLGWRKVRGRRRAEAGKAWYQ